ncbi:MULTISPECIES: hypothetical protein [unclassified Sphingomonas]|nr:MULTISPECIES: hypothetical protein [unclassified Sphingomonas]
MRNLSNISLSQSLASMAGAIVVSLFALGLTTASGPFAFTLAAAPMA